MNTASIYRFLHRSLWVVALCATVFICLLNLVYQSEVTYDALEKVTLSHHFLPSLLMVAVLFGVGVIVFRSQDWLSRCDDKRLFRILSCVYGVFAFYLILNVDSTLRADAKLVHDIAIQFEEGNYDALKKGGYLYRYPHQLGLVLYNQILMLFSKNPQFAFFVNYWMVLGINCLCWKISDVIFHDRLVNIFTLILSFAFLPQLFFILFAYGLIPGFFFMMLGFYHTLLFMKTQRIRNLIVLLVSVATAVLLKQNYLIGGVAIGITLLLQMIKKFNVRYLLSILALVLLMTLPSVLVQKCYEKKVDVTLDNACPSILWLVMGTNIDNTQRGPGWYDASNWNIYDASHHSQEAAAAVGAQMLAENMAKIKSEPGRATRFAIHKNASQWCEPMFQSVWSGPLADTEQYTHTALLQSVYGGNVWEDVFETWSKFVCLAIWILSAVFLLLYWKHTEGWEMLFLYFIGGLIFHTFWEAKSQYTMTYVFCLIPFVAYAGRAVLKQIRKE